jgi:hypothetical protein
MAYGYYPTFKGKIWEWALDENPSGIQLCVALCGVGFSYDASHETLGQLSGVLYSGIEFESIHVSATGLLTAPNLLIENLTPNDRFEAIVLYWAWAGGTETQLFCYTTQSEDQTLPIDIVGTTLTIKFPVEGIFQL